MLFSVAIYEMIFCLYAAYKVGRVHTYCKRVTIGAVIVCMLAHLGHIWGTYEHVCPHPHTMFFSKSVCVCVSVRLHFRRLGFPFFFSSVLLPPSLSQS